MQDTLTTSPQAGITASLSVACALLASCVTVKQYPSRWAVLEPIGASACPSIEGTYNDAGDGEIPPGTICRAGDTKGDLRCRSLSYNFSSGFGVMGVYVPPAQGDPAYSAVKIEQLDDETLRLSFLSPPGERTHEAVRLLKRSSGDYSCGPEGLTIAGRSDFTSLIGANFIRSEARHFRAAADRSLVLQVHSSGVGHYTLIPIANSSEYWVRWVLIDKNEQPQSRSIGVGN